MNLTPEEFKKEFTEYLEQIIGKLKPWQKQIIEKMTLDYAAVTRQTVPMGSGHTHSYSLSNLDICKPPCPVIAEVGYSNGWRNKAKQEEVTPMASYATANVITADSIESAQREAVRSTLRSAYDKVRSELKKQFGLVDDDAPRSPAELVKRIADGHYTIDKEYVDYEGWGAESAIRYIRWRNPETVEDKAGYKAARAKLDEAYEDAKLKAVLLPVADLLQLVEDFKAFKA